MNRLLLEIAQNGARVLDCGSKIHNDQDSYRPIVEGLGMRYEGLDISPGPNVDIVANIYEVGPELGQWDVVISGQFLEHLVDPIRAMERMARLARAGGWMVHIVPFKQNVHRYPIDCWRVAPDGMAYMLRDCVDVEVGLERGGAVDCYGRGMIPR